MHRWSTFIERQDVLRIQNTQRILTVGQEHLSLSSLSSDLTCQEQEVGFSGNREVDTFLENGY